MIAAFLLGAALGAAAAAGLMSWRQRRSRLKLGRYLAFAAHELNGPLTALTMTMSNVTANVFGDVPAALQPWMQLSREQVSRLSALAGQLRDFVHLELTGDYAGARETQAPVDVVESAVKTVQTSFAQSAVPIAVDVPRDLPEVTADPDRIARDLAGLLHHARKLRSGGPVGLSARASGRFVDFIVAFDGPALEPGEARRSVDLYYPGEGSKTLRSAGLGLGLVARLQAEDGGTFSLEVDGTRHRAVMRAPIAARK